MKTIIEVFKTNVQEVPQAENIVALLQAHLPGSKVNFDLDDCDKVLRVEASSVMIGNVIRLVNEKGYHCNPLE